MFFSFFLQLPIANDRVRSDFFNSGLFPQQLTYSFVLFLYQLVSLSEFVISHPFVRHLQQSDLL